MDYPFTLLLPFYVFLLTPAAVIGSTQQLQSSSSQSSSSSATTGDSSLQQQPQQQKPLMSCAGIPVEENLKIAKSYFTTDIAAGRDPAVPFRYVERT